MKLLFFVLALAVALSGCSGGSSSSGSGDSVTTASIGGAVTKGPVGGATVNVYQMDASGEQTGDPVAGPITTAADGSWNVSVPLSVARPLLVVASGGTYIDEATGTEVSVNSRTLSSFLTEGATTASVSPLSETVVRRARQFLTTNPGSPVSEGVDDGVAKVREVFGEGFDPLADLPDPNGSTVESRKAAAILGGLSQLANDQSPTTDPLDTVLALSEDVTDGVIDGQSEGSPIEINGDDGNLTTAVNSDAYLTAVNTYTSNPENGDFADITSFKVTSEAAPVMGGEVSPAEVVLFEGDTASFTLSPATGYQIGGVSGCAGTRAGSVFQTDALNAACTLTATFELIPYTVTVASVAGGTASTSGETVLHGQTLEIVFTEDVGFDLASVEGCGGSLVDLTYTTGPITGDCTVTPSYVLETRTVTLTSNVENVTFDPVGPTIDLDYGSVLEVTVTPDPGFVLDSVTGCDGTLNGDLFTTGSVTANCTITATVSAAPIYTVSTSVTGPGSIDPTSAQVTEGNTLQLTLTPDANAALSDVGGCNGAQSAENPLVFTTGPVTANCTVTAQFDPIYTITVNVGENGSATPAPTVEALAGETPEITITPDSGFVIDAVGGTCGGTLNGNVYTVDAVSTDCSVEITFVAEETGLPGAVWDEFNWDEANWQ